MRQAVATPDTPRGLRTGTPGRRNRVVLLLILLSQIVTLPAPEALAASSVTVAAWSCPDGLAGDLDRAGYQAACTEAAEGITFSLATGGLNRRRVTAAGKPATWPAVAGDFQLSIDAPAGEPAVVFCNQSSGEARFDAPEGMISGTIADGDTLDCNWYRTSGAPAPTIEPTTEPEPSATTAPVTPEATVDDGQTPVTEGDSASGDFSGMIDVGGRSLFLQCNGTGATTMIFEAGGPGGSSARWESIIASISPEDYRLCSYDRAGLGKSDPGIPGTRTIQDSVNDLRALVLVARLACPCVFVGESWGANIVRLYAGQYPATVSGMVLVDPIPPGFVEDFVSLVSSEAPGYATLMGSENPESMDQLASLRQADTATAPPPIPTTILTHGLNLGFPISYPVDQLEARWQARQLALAQSLNAFLVVAETSSNSILNDQPELVIDAINGVGADVADPANARHAVVIHRFDGNNKPLTGACYQIYVDAGGGERGDYRGGACDADFDGKDNGVITLVGLQPGDYVVQEIEPPKDIEAAEDTPVTVVGSATHLTLKTGQAQLTSVVVQLEELNDSGMTGTATLTAQGNQTEVAIHVLGAQGGHPVHIHTGSCENLGEVQFPLNDIDADGRSTTVVDITLADLLSGDYAINAHRSAEDIVSYVACGKVEIPEET